LSPSLPRLRDVTGFFLFPISAPPCRTVETSPFSLIYCRQNPILFRFLDPFPCSCVSVSIAMTIQKISFFGSPSLFLPCLPFPPPFLAGPSVSINCDVIFWIPLADIAFPLQTFFAFPIPRRKKPRPFPVSFSGKDPEAPSFFFFFSFGFYFSQNKPLFDLGFFCPPFSFSPLLLSFQVFSFSRISFFIPPWAPAQREVKRLPFSFPRSFPLLHPFPLISLIFTFTYFCFSHRY